MADEDDLNAQQGNEEAAQPEQAQDLAGGMMPDVMTETSSSKGKVNIAIWILIVSGVILILPYYFFYQWGHHTGYKKIFKPSVSKMRGKTPFSPPTYPIENLTINLRDSDKKMYVQMSLQLALRSDAELSELATREVELRDMIILLVNRYTSKRLNSVTEQRKLKRLIKGQMNVILEKARVTEIYFSEFYMNVLKPVDFQSA